MKIERKIIKGLNQTSLVESKYVVAHEAGNPNNTGHNSLDNEVSYMTNNHRNAFTSDFVGGGGRIIQLAEVGKVQWGAGPKANPYTYAHVELARTKNTDTFNKDYKAWVWLLRKRAVDAGIPLKFDESGKGIKSHRWISNNLGGTTHVDPFGYLQQFGISENQLKNDIENGIDGVVDAKPSAPSKPSTNIDTKTVKQLAKEVIDGKHGSGEARKKSLGGRYDEVQQRVNAMLNPGDSRKPAKGIATLAKEVIDGKHGSGEARKKSLGKRYSEVQARVNEVLSGTTKKKPAKGITTLAREVIAGKHGTGDARKKSLGSRYAEVQARVNELSSPKKSKKPKSTATLVAEVNKGLHGNGEACKKSLGSDYNRVQSYINKNS